MRSNLIITLLPTTDYDCNFNSAQLTSLTFIFHIKTLWKVFQHSNWSYDKKIAMRPFFKVILGLLFWTSYCLNAGTSWEERVWQIPDSSKTVGEVSTFSTHPATSQFQLASQPHTSDRVIRISQEGGGLWMQASNHQDSLRSLCWIRSWVTTLSIYIILVSNLN